ncbi:leucine-rich repeat-containing protein 17-like [Lampetra fluviatilis]
MPGGGGAVRWPWGCRCPGALLVFSLVIIALLPCISTEKNPRRQRPGARTRACSGDCRREQRAFPRSVDECEVFYFNEEKSLDCRGRGLTSLSAKIPHNIIHLNMAQNKISVLLDYQFVKFQELKSLDLSGNVIQEMQANAFAGLNVLHTLLLQFNRLALVAEEVFIHLPKLQFLRIYKNPWHCSCEMEGMLHWLQLPSSRHMALYAECSSPSELAGEKLKKVNLQVLCPAAAWGAYSSQTDPSKNTTDPKEETVQDLTPQVTTIGKCVVTNFPTHAVNCHGKGLLMIPKKLPLDITSLDMSSNQIHSLLAGKLQSFRHLRFLSLRNNSLDYIHPDALAGLHVLEHVDLRNNRLSSLEFGTLKDMYHLQSLLIEDNPWRCDFDIHYMVYWFSYHMGVRYGEPVCTQPSEFKGWTLANYMRRYYSDCSARSNTRGGLNQANSSSIENQWDIRNNSIDESVGISTGSIGVSLP